MRDLTTALNALWAARMTQPMPSLPPDVLRAIFAHLSNCALIRIASRVSKLWRSVALRSVTSYTATAYPSASWDFNHAISLLPSLTHLKLTQHRGSCAPVTLPSALVSLEVNERDTGLIQLAASLPARLTHLSVRLNAQTAAVSQLVSASAASLVSLSLTGSRTAPAIEISNALERARYPKLTALVFSVDSVMPGVGSHPTPPVEGLYIMLRRHVTQLRSLTLFSHHTVGLPTALTVILTSVSLSSLQQLTVIGMTFLEAALCRHLPPDLSVCVSGLGKPFSPALLPLLPPKVTCIDADWSPYFCESSVDPPAYINLPRLTRIQRLGLYAGTSSPQHLADLSRMVLCDGRAKLVTGVRMDYAARRTTHAVLQRCPNLTCIKLADLDRLLKAAGPDSPLPMPANLTLWHVTRLSFVREILHINFIAMLRAMLGVCPNLARVVAEYVRNLDVADLGTVLAAHRNVEFVRIGTLDVAAAAAVAVQIQATLPVRLSIKLYVPR